MRDDTLFTQVEHLLRRIGYLEEVSRRPVHAHIRRLRTQRNSHDKRVGVDMLKLTLGSGSAV